MLEAANEYAAKCFTQYGMNTDNTGRYSSMYKPFHLIGMELNTSIFRCYFKESYGCTKEFSGDVIATAKQNLKKGSYWMVKEALLFGENFTKQFCKKINGLPIGLANNVKLKNDVEKDAPVCWSDVDLDINCPVVKIREKIKLS